VHLNRVGGLAISARRAAFWFVSRLPDTGLDYMYIPPFTPITWPVM
jgi:hypothetical protein